MPEAGLRVDRGPDRPTPEGDQPSLVSGQPLQAAVRSGLDTVERARAVAPDGLHMREIGTVIRVGHGVALIDGLPGTRAEELVRFPGGRLGIALDLVDDRVGVVLLDPYGDIAAGDRVERTGRVMDVPVGERLLGRTVDPAGRPRDGGPPVGASERRPIERPAPPMMDRAPVREPLQTGIVVIDALIPIGRGQRELIVGDRQTGKTTIAVDTILAQRERDVISVYCAIGQRTSSIAGVIADLRDRDALSSCVIVATSGDDPAGLQYAAPYAAMTIAEWFMEHGHDALIVLDDLTRHARAYREISLLLRRPPGREAFPGDIFYLHSRLLERATHLSEERGGGSLTALPIVETQAQDISAYIPTNLISITDGQIYVSPRLFGLGQLPAVDVGMSVSRVGGKAQLAAYRAVAGDLRLAYTQFEELERFSRYGARLDADGRRTLERGRRVRAALRQPPYRPIDVAEQITTLVAVAEGLFDRVDSERVTEGRAAIGARMRDGGEAIAAELRAGAGLDEGRRDRLLALASGALREAGLMGSDHGDD